MARSIWKGPFVDGFLLKKAEKARGSGSNAIIKMWSRRSTILPQFVGLTFGVHNGQKHIPVLVTEDMVGPPYDADNMYGWAKLMAEMTLRAYTEETGMKTANCRYFTDYGDRGHENDDRNERRIAVKDVLDAVSSAVPRALECGNAAIGAIRHALIILALRGLSRCYPS